MSNYLAGQAVVARCRDSPMYDTTPSDVNGKASEVSRRPRAAAPAVEPASPVLDAWRTNADGLRALGKAGEVNVFTCPPGGAAESVTGTGPYTSDSSVCTAAVHAGLITFERGGAVTVVHQGPQPVFGSIPRNGVRPRLYGVHSLSFLFRSEDGQTAPAPSAQGVPINWQVRHILGAAAGTKITLWCPPNGTTESLWGTDVYSEYSNPCAAAAHAGAITVERGGTFDVETRPGQEFKGSTRNGITSDDDAYNNLSFIVIGSTTR